MTMENPWEKFDIGNYKLYDENRNMVLEIDRQAVAAYNAGKDHEKQFQTHLLPEPFHGNLYSAKVIFLSLNPGYVERLNKDLAQYVSDMNVGVHMGDFLKSQMDLRASSFAPNKEYHRDLYYAYQTLGDWYWHDKLNTLRMATGLSEDQFNERIGLIQLIPYASSVCDKPITDLPSQQFTKTLVKELLSKEDKPLFVVLRSEPEWGEMFGIEVSDKRNEFVENRNFIIRKRDKNGHRPRGQFINENAFYYADDFQRLVDKIKEK